MAAVGAAALCAHSRSPGMTMNPHLQLYQFIRDVDWISVARITQVEANPGPQAGQETVKIGVQVEENLWGDSGPSTRTYVFRRPASRTAQRKFPDPVWGRVDLRPGAKILLVRPPAKGSAAQDPVYVEEILRPDDPVMGSIRGVINQEGTQRERPSKVELYLHWVAGGSTVEKLFAGQALSKDGPTPAGWSARINLAVAGAFASEKDEYVKISLGSWLWDDLFPHADEEGRVSIVNATIRVASSGSTDARRFALDRLSAADPQLLRRQGVKPSGEIVRLLEDRKEKETDADVRRHLDEIIEALRR